MTTMNQTIAGASIRETLRNALLRLTEWAEKHSQIGQAAEQAKRLSRMSDAELDKIGLQRNQIYHHAFSRFFYI